VRWVKHRETKGSEANENGPCFSVAEAVLIPLAVVVRMQVALIRWTLYAAFSMDRFIVRLRESKN
jgi:hypothetical protein